MCNFSEPWFGATYEDSFCVDGYLYDADKDGYDPHDKSHSCPQCNTKEFLEDVFEKAESISEFRCGAGGIYICGNSHTIWENGCALARKFNPTAAEEIITGLGIPKFA